VKYGSYTWALNINKLIAHVRGPWCQTPGEYIHMSICRIERYLAAAKYKFAFLFGNIEGSMQLRLMVLTQIDPLVDSSHVKGGMPVDATP